MGTITRSFANLITATGTSGVADGSIVNADISSTAGITLNKISGNPNFRNRIINGDMSIDQRNAGASVTVNSTAEYYSVDRFFGQGQSADGVYTLQQSTTTPAGFSNSIVATVTTEDISIGATQYYSLCQRIEGFNTADLSFGTASAKTVTLSFWTRSSLTGTFGGALTNNAFDRSYPFTYSISVANTWEYKTITIAGDTSGTWVGSTNGIGLRIFWGLGVGSTYSGTAGAWANSLYLSATGATSVVGTNGATFYMTGVQLEAGTSATDFEFLPIDVSLGRCGRYYEKSYSYGTVAGTATNTGMRLGNHNSSATTGYLNNNTVFSYYKRATPTVTIYDNAGNSGKSTRSIFGGTETTNQNASTDAVSEKSFHVFSNTGSNSNVMYYHFIADSEL